MVQYFIHERYDSYRVLVSYGGCGDQSSLINLCCKLSGRTLPTPRHVGSGEALGCILVAVLAKKPAMPVMFRLGTGLTL